MRLQKDFLPALTGRSPPDVARQLLGLPAWLGGISIPDLSATCEAANATLLSQLIVDLIQAQHSKDIVDRLHIWTFVVALTHAFMLLPNPSAFPIQFFL